ncbi:MAG TPA: hypothetical protein VFV54_04355, partial [Thermoanaerobaculia bacterium]|nr:hypothetical protein [Thermoanaerobaculia bacterium]
MKGVRIYHSASFPSDSIRTALEKRGAALIPVAALTEIPREEAVQIVLLDAALLEQFSSLPPTGPATLFLGVGLDGRLPADAEERIYLQMPASPPPHVLATAIKRAAEHARDRLEKEWLAERMTRVTRELDETHKIGIALSTVRDHDVLLPMILTKARDLSRSDAGSLYLLDDDPQRGRVLRWKLAQNDSIPVNFKEKTLAITKESLAGYVALT